MVMVTRDQVKEEGKRNDSTMNETIMNINVNKL